MSQSIAVSPDFRRMTGGGRGKTLTLTILEINVVIHNPMSCAAKLLILVAGSEGESIDKFRWIR
jgi:hypothetical protein